MVEEEKKELRFEERVSKSADDLAFVRFFREQGVCWRCIFLLYKEHDLDLYRSHERMGKLDTELLQSQTSESDPAKNMAEIKTNSSAVCAICLDVLTKAELSAAIIAQNVKASGYEYADFKITFSISLRAYLNRLNIITKAESVLAKSFSQHTNKAQYRGSLDFKEVFKWVMSPILTKELGVPANLTGSFLISCVFQR